VTEPPEIQLRFPARPENVALVRQALSGIGDTFAVAPTLLADMKTAVTEACNNVVLHAYPDSEGILEVDASPDDQRVAIVVRDEGSGMQPRPVQPEEPSLGLGLPLIAALSDRFEIHGGVGRGIEVRMLFRINEDVVPDDSNGIGAARAPTPSPYGTARAAGVAITPGPLMAPVLGRLIAMFASRADFQLDRLSEAVLVTDAISAHADAYIPGRHVSLAFENGKGMLDVWVGPLIKGGADELLATMEIPGLQRSLRDLADEVKVERVSDQAEARRGAGEYLLLRLGGGMPD
jgi:serine/threonine-protein kinase RsbW